MVAVASADRIKVPGAEVTDVLLTVTGYDRADGGALTTATTAASADDGKQSFFPMPSLDDLDLFITFVGKIGVGAKTDTVGLYYLMVGRCRLTPGFRS